METDLSEKTMAIRVGVLGFGGLGKAAARVLAGKREMLWVAAVDRQGYAYHPEGLMVEPTLAAAQQGTVGHLGGYVGPESLARAIAEIGPHVDGFFLALPNLPNDFIARTTEQFVEIGWSGVLVDAIKRTSAVEHLLTMGDRLVTSRITYLTGCGATPGLLTAAAALAAQSFAEVHRVHIWFGVGIANWQAYQATIREDIAHMPGYDVETARALTDAEIEALLERTDGLLTLESMEHADDVLLERLGICDRSQVTVGGVVDTRRPQKPVSTTLKVTGRTFEGAIATHTLTLGDETSMAANVCGPALGYLKAGWEMHRRGWHGIFTSADTMPRFVR
jgi:hypothetical protein